MSITIVMPVLGRPLFTLRSLWYLNSIGLPWKVIVADGGNYRAIRRILGDKGNFPNLDLTYFRSPDVDVRAYYRKCLAAVRMAETPYVQILDNDDFITINALKTMAAFLDAHPDHSAVGGIVSNVHIGKSARRDGIRFVQGPADRWTVMYDPKFLEQSTAAERVGQHLSRYFPTYYSLHRKQAKADAYDFLVRTGIRDLPLHEIFLSLHTLLSGKITTICSTVGYLRQANSSEAHATVRPWPHRILQDAWQSDFRSAVEEFARTMHALEPSTSLAAARDLLQDRIGWFISTVSTGSAYHGSRPDALEAMLAELKGYGATDQDCAALVSDWIPVIGCLDSAEFRRFLAAEAGDLLALWKLQHLPDRVWAAWKNSAIGRSLRHK